MSLQGEFFQDTGPMSQSTETSKPSTPVNTEEKSTSSPPVCHVKVSATPAKGRAKKTHVISGRKLLESLNKRDPLMFLSKTLLASSTWHSTHGNLIWQMKATPLGRLRYQLRLLKHTTKEQESGLSESYYMMPTPTTTESAPNQNANTKGPKTLNEVSQTEWEAGQEWWPTPDCQNHRSGSSKRDVEKNGRTPGTRHGLSLHHAVEQSPTFWPTPTVQEGSKISNQPNYGQVALSNHPEIVGYPERPKGKKTQKSEIPEKILYPTPAAQEPGWKHIEVVDKDGNPPEHPNQRFYHKETGRVVQKGLEQVVMMWPTPNTMDSLPARENIREINNSRDGRKNRQTLSNLREAVVDPEYNRLWPTPTASDTRHGWAQKWEEAMNEPEKKRSRDLRDAVAAEPEMWPTPSANQFECKDIDQMLKRREECKERNQNGNGFGLTLANAALLWPTPNSRDWKDSVNTVPPSVGETRGHTLGMKVAEQEKMYPTPRHTDYKGAGSGTNDQSIQKRIDKGMENLSEHVQAMERNLFPTPTASDHHGSGEKIIRKDGKSRMDRLDYVTEQDPKYKAKGAALNPDWVEALQGYPPGWTIPSDGETELGKQESPE